MMHFLFRVTAPVFILTASLAAFFPAQAKTLVLDGRLSGEVTVTQHVTFGNDRTLSELTYRFPLPHGFQSPSVSQRLTGHQLRFDPQPASVREETDAFGNRFKLVTWRKLNGDARITVVFTTEIDAALTPLEAEAPFPPVKAPVAMEIYLQPAPLVQSGHQEVIARAAELTAGAATQAAAVDAILNFVADHIRYETPPKSYDALFGLRTGTGNCQNYAHLACALLRASGIPARVAVGLTLKDKWKIPTGHNSSIVQGMGEGLHAWIEVWFPGLGWLPCDPQQSKQFTSTRHIKYAHGPECGATSPSWRGVPALPRYASVISNKFSRDNVDLRLKSAGDEPRGYLVSNEMITAVAKSGPMPPTKQKPPRRPLAPVPPPFIRETDKDGLIEIGNLRLPAVITLFTESGDRGEATLERETAEYVTSTDVYAQAFRLDRPLTLTKVSLAMKKFGGDGAVYVDIVADENGRPAITTGVRSFPVDLEIVRRLPGYGWLDFAIPADTMPFPPGKYWIVLRRSGEAIMNWLYTPGKPYGGPDDTRSTARGWQWEDILTYDFVFKVTGQALR